MSAKNFYSSFKAMPQKDAFDALFALIERIKDTDLKFSPNNRTTLNMLRASIAFEHMAKRSVAKSKTDAGSGLRLEMVWMPEIND